ncbi:MULTISPECIES: ribosome maturation factor RimP [unclassified Synechocystis]|uniref:ribosome maturation factor RimP n=1 Tax=unclassified Synechocystis TaxID=2640012 RepID=UPI0003FF081A|nr:MULTISPECIES: ribosome maturation factor RimP [unclassified Synechocystis]AIE75105.1 transcription termination protein NusA-like protein [Synechocystis sp. PCC 6714]
MTHPVIPEILALAQPIAEDLGLEVMDAVFQTNKRPPVLRIDVRNLRQDTSLNDCEAFSRSFDARLEQSTLITSAYVLEVSSPGVSPYLVTERDFIAFKGFEVVVSSDEPHQGQSQWQGSLQGRDGEAVYLSIKGRTVTIPVTVGLTVRLP